MLDQGPRTRADFEQTMQQLVGRRVEAVSYFEIPYDIGQPMWNRESDAFDSLDFGLELKLDDGSRLSVTWGTEFTQYNVSICRSSLRFVDGESARRWDAAQRWRERGCLDTPIISTRATWLPAGAPDGREYPQDLRFEFELGAVVVISAFESRYGDLNMGMMDHITVFFDEAEARRMVHCTEWRSMTPMDDQQLEARLCSEWDRICQAEEAHGFAALAHRDQVFHDIWMLEAELNNGGFSQYMFNSAGDRGIAATEALREVGAGALAKVCERFYALLSDGAPASDQDARQAQLDEVVARMGVDAFENACSDLENEFYAGEDELRRLLVAYLEKHPDRT